MVQLTNNDLNKTVYVHPTALEKERQWRIVDASWKTLGKLAVEIARKLCGKDNVHYCDFWDCGDYVVVTNVEKVAVTGNKLEDKIYYKHTQWRGHLKKITLGTLLKKHPRRVLEFAVRGMLPKNKLRKKRLKRLKLIVGDTHNYTDKELKELSV